MKFLFYLTDLIPRSKLRNKRVRSLLRGSYFLLLNSADYQAVYFGGLSVKQSNIIQVRFFTSLVMLAVLAGGPVGQALAQSGGGDAVTAAFAGVVETITDIIQGLTVVVGILGIVLYGFGKVARGIFPEIAQMTQQYLKEFIIGIVVVFGAATIVEAVVSSIEGSF
jgi:type IV secretory pathway VirB2 component (pilin)